MVIATSNSFRFFIWKNEFETVLYWYWVRVTYVTYKTRHPIMFTTMLLQLYFRFTYNLRYLWRIEKKPQEKNLPGLYNVTVKYGTITLPVIFDQKKNFLFHPITAQKYIWKYGFVWMCIRAACCNQVHIYDFMGDIQFVCDMQTTILQIFTAECRSWACKLTFTWMYRFELSTFQVHCIPLHNSNIHSCI